MVALRSMVACLFMLTLGLPLTAESQPERVTFIPLATPCRALDTRQTGMPIPANEPTPIQISGPTAGPGGDCGVPATAVGAALNFTTTEAQGTGFLTAWPSGDLPLASVVNLVPGEDVANAVDIGLGADGTVLVQAFAPTHLVVDIYGYFTGGELAGSNTALGESALLNTTSTNNTALGANALLNDTTGNSNTATGSDALRSNTTGNQNTATGWRALAGSTTGSGNTAMGANALANDIGQSNTALGVSALTLKTTGDRNIALGFGAGSLVLSGNENIHIGHIGALGDTSVIRIGTQGVQALTFIAGISGTTVAAGTQVLVDGNGQLGTLPSSRRVKDEIRGTDEASAGLGKLRPVVFRYKAELANGPRPLEYGLIAEEVAEIYPELVVLGTDGQPAGVKYHVLPAMLLNEFQRQQRQLESQAARLEAQRRELEELRAQVRALIGARASSRE
jgi:hypothetical protein